MTSLADAITGTGLMPPTPASQLNGGIPSANDTGQKTPAMTQNVEDQARVEQAGRERDKFTEEGKPKFPELGTPPKAEESNDPVKGYVSAIGVLGAIGSMFTRVPMTNSMNAAAGVLNAMKANDQAVFKQKFDEWKVQNDNALKLFDYQNATYKDILNAKNKSVDERISELHANAAAFKDDLMMQLAKDRNPSIIDDHLAKADEARGKLQESIEKIQVAQEKQQHVSEGLDVYATLHPNATKAEIFAEKTRLQQEAASFGKKGADSGKSTLTPDGLKMSATTLLLTGQMPNLGMGGKEDKEAIVNEAARMAKEQGISYEDVIAGRAAFKADASALTTIERAANSVESFETTAKLNMDNAMRLMSKGAGTEAGSVLNRWIQGGRKATGDPDVAAFNAALYTATTEYAKVMSGAVTAQALTDSARKEAEDKILNVIDSSSAIAKVYKEVMVPDMENRKTGLNQQIADIRKNLGSENKKTDQPSQEDLEYTAKKNNMTVDEVKKKLGIQ